MRYFFYAFLITALASCKKDEQDNPSVKKGVYIINEGNFNFGNGDVSVFDRSTGNVSNNIFLSANGYPAGDVVQSLYVMDTIGFLVVNNSRKIEVVKLPSFKRIKTIQIPLSSPRYFLPLDDSIAYVSELYAKKIWVINYINGQVMQSIATGGWTEKMIMKDGFVYVQQKPVSTMSSTTGAVLKVNPVSHSISTSIGFDGRNIGGMVEDKVGKIWITVDEDTSANLFAKIVALDKDLNVVKSIPFNSYNHNPGRLCIDSSGSMLYFLDKNIFSLATSANSLNDQAIIDCAGKNVYAMDVEPSTNHLFVSDALDYVQLSRIFIYNSSGNELQSLSAGIVSGNFVFQ